MRHRRKGSRLNRKSNQLKALLRSLVTSLVLNGKMVTTKSKAKALVPVFDRLVTRARQESKMNAIRDIKKILFGEEAQRRLMNEIIPQLEGRSSGFTSQLKIGFRAGDNAQMVRIEILSNKKKEGPVVEAETESLENAETVEATPEKKEA